MDFERKQKRGFLKHNFYFIAGAFLFLSASALLILADVRIYKEKQKLTAQLDGYKKQIQEIENRNKALKEGITEANNNNYIEKVAREELDLQKQGEKVVTFIMPPQQPKKENKQRSFFDFKIWLSRITNGWQWIKNKI